MILAVCLNPAIDRTSEVDFFPFETVKRVRKSVYSAGGKGVNISRVMKKLGAEALTVGLSGGHTGRFFESLLENEGLKGRFIKIKGETRINATLIDPASGKEMHLVDAGPAVTGAEIKEFLDLYAGILADKKIDCAVFSGSLPPGAPRDFYAGLVSSARKSGILTALDTSGKPLEEGVKAKPDIIKPNSEELDGLAGVKLRGVREKMYFAMRLDIPETLVSMGGRGSFLCSGGKILRAGPAGAPAASSVGSGDALLAGYIFSRILKNKSPEEALATGSACARANIRSRLPGGVSIRDIHRLKHGEKVKRMKR